MRPARFDNVRFEDAILWVANGGRARRACWAHTLGYTQATPPMSYERKWRIWIPDDCGGGIVQGWGGQVGAMLPPGEQIRDGTLYAPSDADRTATDWELFER